MRIDFAIVNGRPYRVTEWTTEAELIGADCSYGYGETLAEAGGVYVSEKDVYSVHLGWLAAGIVGGIAGAAVLAVAAMANMPQDLASAPLPQCGGIEEDSKDCSREGRQSPAGGWVDSSGRGSGRDKSPGVVARRGCNGGDCRGEFPETVPQPDRTKGLA